jgi:hypothetical protein
VKRLGIVALGWLAACGIGAAAEVSGKVTLKGTPPPEKVVDLSGYPDPLKVYQDKGVLKTRHYLVSPEGGLMNVFVYIQRGLEGKTFPLATNTPVLNQTNCGFYPYVMGVQTNQTFLVMNSEPYMETVHALPKKNTEFNIGQPITGMVTPQRFDLAEVLIKIKCELHPWEFAFVGVVEHPFFAVSDKDGAYRLPPNLPPGQYVIEAVHPKAGSVTQELRVGAGDAKMVDFVLEVPPPK